MLVLSRKIGQQIRIGDQITLTIVKTQGQTVRVGIEAPREVRVVRAELPPRLASDDTTDNLAVSTGTPRTLMLSRGDTSSDDRQPEKTSPQCQRRTQPGHPQRWTVATMRERIQVPATPRATAAEPSL